MTTAMQVARYIDNTKFVFGEMQLQKLLYYTQAWSLAWTGKPLFTDEIEAWTMGPVVRDVWATRKYGEIGDDVPDLDPTARALVDAVYEHYGVAGGAALSERTHKEEPWLEARGDLSSDARSSAAVSQATMRRCYTFAALEDGGNVPKRPMLETVAESPERARAAGQRQSRRWRQALDALAQR